MEYTFRPDVLDLLIDINQYPELEIDHIMTPFGKSQDTFLLSQGVIMRFAQPS